MLVGKTVEDTLALWEQPNSHNVKRQTLLENSRNGISLANNTVGQDSKNPVLLYDLC